MIEIANRLIAVLTETPAARFFFRLASAALALFAFVLLASLIALGTHRALNGATIEIFGIRITGPSVDPPTPTPTPTPAPPASFNNSTAYYAWRLGEVFPDVETCNQALRFAFREAAHHFEKSDEGGDPMNIQVAWLKQGGIAMAGCPEDGSTIIVSVGDEAPVKAAEGTILKALEQRANAN
jgi:hypothetical protein